MVLYFNAKDNLGKNRRVKCELRFDGWVYVKCGRRDFEILQPFVGELRTSKIDRKGIITRVSRK